MFLGISWLVWYLLLVAAYAGWTSYHPRLWIPLDVAAFNADGSHQSLGSVFHRQRTIWRTIGAVVPAIVASLPLWLHYEPRWWYALLPVLALVSGHAGYWVWYFNPNLSVARKLDYIDKWHVSWAANASWLDRHIWHEAWEQVHVADRSHQFDFVPGKYDKDVEDRAREIYPKLLRELLWSGWFGTLLFQGFFFLLLHKFPS